MPYTIEVPSGYGYVSGLALSAIPVLAFVHCLLVTVLRTRTTVKYPDMYATTQQAKASPAAYKFNCAQRAHGNLLENMPQTIGMMMFAGLGYPRATAVLGLAWVVLRTVFLVGYVYSERPYGSGRLVGLPFWLAQGGLWFLCLASSRKLL